MPILDSTLEITSQKSYQYYNDFILFATDLLTYHGEMVYDFSKVHTEVINHILSNRYALVVLPRGHLKTTILNCYALWRLFREKNYQLLLVSSTLDQSMGNLAWVQKMVETTPWLKSLAPTNKSVSWNKSQITTSNNNLCYVKPFNPSARGKHPNEVLYDDILREADVSMEEIKNIFWAVFFPMGQTKNCKHLIVGTPITATDLFVEIEDKSKKENSIWKVMKRAAIVDGKPLWDKRFTLKELDDIKEDMGLYRFNREFLCDPAAEGSGFYPSEFVLNATDDQLQFNYNTTGTITIGADFAMSESASGDYNCFIVTDIIHFSVLLSLLACF